MNQDIAFFRYKRKIVVGEPWVFDFGKTGRVDGDIILDDGNIITARQVLEGTGRVPLTKAAKKLVAWVRKCGPKWLATARDDDYDYEEERGEEEECSCRDCRRQSDTTRLFTNVVPNCTCSDCQFARSQGG